MKLICFTLMAFAALSAAQAEDPCEQGMASTAPAPKRRQQDRNIQRISRWLSLNASAIDPQTTHLEILIPLALDIVREIETALPGKSTEKKFEEREPLVRAVLAEIRERCERGPLTYEYINGLPVRLGFLMEMRGEITQFIESKSLVWERHDAVYEPETYRTHEAFRQMVQLAMVAGKKGLNMRSDWYPWQRAMDTFPELHVVPQFDIMPLRELNWLLSGGGWPALIQTRPEMIDRRELNEMEGPFHDYIHILIGGHSTSPAPFIATQIRLPIQRRVLIGIEREARRDPEMGSALHFVHFTLFHENNYFLFINPDSGLGMDRATMTGLRAGLAMTVSLVAKALNLPPGVSIGFNIDKAEFLDLVPAGRDPAQFAEDLSDRYATLIQNAIVDAEIIPILRQTNPQSFLPENNQATVTAVDFVRRPTWLQRLRHWLPRRSYP